MGVTPQTAWHSDFTISFVTSSLPSIVRIYKGTCGMMTEVQLEAGSIAMSSF